MKKPSVLLIDDDRNFLRVLTHYVREFGLEATPLTSGMEAVEKLQQSEFDLVVTDLRMPEVDGLQVLAAAREVNPELPVLVLTAYGSIDQAVRAIKMGAFDFLTKPFDKEEMRHSIANALRMADLIKENRTLSRAVQEKFKFEGIVGSSKKFREVLGLASQLAGVDTTVLIQGESGTGKEILARAIHFNSPRSRKPFVVVNCGAIPETLVESELFGHRRGSFTGAVADQKGKFEAADEGTILLDEVGELPLNVQVKLLRVLQEGEIDVVGATNPTRVDIRVVAATNQDLPAQMEAGRFREDLYYRLAVAPLVIPPLRDRKADIPLLVHHFLNRFNREFGKNVTLGTGVVDALQHYRWPGNVRELENIVHRLVVFDRDDTVLMDALPPSIRAPLKSIGRVQIELPEEGFSMEELERDLLAAALEKHEGNQTRAAGYLGITRNTLLYRMQKFGLRPDSEVPAEKG